MGVIFYIQRMRFIITIAVDTYRQQGTILERRGLLDITTIHDDALVEIIRNRLQDKDLDELEEQIGPFMGGIAIATDHEVHITPMCCGDIGDISDWEAIPEAEPGKWVMLWIGHPWIYYRTSEHNIDFSNYCEQTPADDAPPFITISRADFQREIAKVRVEQDHFKDRVQQALDLIGIENTAQIAAQMTRW